MSGEANGLTVDLEGALDPEHAGDAGVPAGAELLAFTNAVELGHDDVDATRAAVAEAIGEQGALEAAATIAIFNGLVRVADGTGIQLDAGLFAASTHDRELLGLDRFIGAENSAGLAAAAVDPATVQEIFGGGASVPHTRT